MEQNEVTESAQSNGTIDFLSAMSGEFIGICIDVTEACHTPDRAVMQQRVEVMTGKIFQLPEWVAMKSSLPEAAGKAAESWICSVIDIAHEKDSNKMLKRLADLKTLCNTQPIAIALAQWLT